MCSMRRISRSHFVKSVLCLCVALSLFMALPLQADAAVGVDGDVRLSVVSQQSFLYLDFFGNYIEDGSGRDITIPYVYRGSHSLAFYLANKDDRYHYVSGSVSIKLTFSLITQSTLNLGNPPRISLSESSLQDGMSVYLSQVSGDASSFTVLLTFNLDNVDLSYQKRGGISLDMSLSGSANAQLFGSAYGYLAYNVSTASDYTGNLVFGASPVDLDSRDRYFNSVFKAQEDILDAISGSVTAGFAAVNGNLQALNSNLSAQGTAIVNKVQSHIDAANSNSRAEIADADKNASDIIAALNRNSQAEVADADKNADDIMNSYDPSQQETDNARLESSRQELQDEEDSLFGSAMDGFASLDMSDYGIGKFSQMQAAFSFVSGFIQSLYVKSGDFGTIVTIGLVLLIATKVIGLTRYQVVEH